MADVRRETIAKNSDARGAYASVNGISLYYEAHGAGTGTPLILLHGGLGYTGMFDELLPILTKGRQVIGVDLQAHGRTADIDRPMRFERMADDIASLIHHLNLEQADVLGYSLGGGVALQTAIRYPELVRKLVLVSTPAKREGWYPEVQAGMASMRPEAAEGMKAGPIYQVYTQIAPRPEDWPVLITKIGELLRQPYDWTNDVQRLKPTTMLMFADADAVRPEHMVEMYELLGGGKRDAGWDGSGMPEARLAILPGRSHYNILSSEMLAPAVISFLDAA